MHELFLNALFLTLPMFLFGINRILFQKRIKFVHSSFSIILSFVLFILCMKDNYDKILTTILWNFCYSFEYICVITSNVYRGEHFMKSMNKKISDVDSLIKEVTNYDVNIKIVIIIIITLLWRCKYLYTLFYGTDDQVSSYVVLITSQIPNLGIELESIWRIFIISIIQNRLNCILKVLRKIYHKEWFEYNHLEEVVNDDVIKIMEAFTILSDMANDVSTFIEVAVSN